MSDQKQFEVLPPEQTTISNVERAEIDISVATAKKYPRSLSAVKRAMMEFATLDQETAQGTFYKLPRGGKVIEGPSIRMAEIAMSCFGNIRAGTRVVAVVDRGPNPHVIVQGVCNDVERNVSITMEKRRRIVGKKDRSGGHLPPTEDDINLATNACSAIALRDAVLKVVPLALVKPVVEAAKRIAVGDATTLAERRGKMLATFGAMGVDARKVFHRVGKRGLDDIGLEDLEILIGLHSAIRDNEISPDEAFPEIPIAEEPKKEDPKKEEPKREPVVHIIPEEPEEPKPQPKAQEPKAAPTETTREKFQRQIQEAGFSFDDFRKFCEVSGTIADVSSVASFDDVHDVIITRFTRSAGAFRGLLDGIKRAVAS